jgi:hypothetical protein
MSWLVLAWLILVPLVVLAVVGFWFVREILDIMRKGL